jgi:sulfite reductase (NADPH) flavoprotein alpha-component
MMEKYPAAISAKSLLKLLRPLSPRLYSIASSQKEVGNEVHLCVNALRFEHEGKTHFGSASRFLTHTIQTGDQIPIYIEHNPHFRLPEKSDSPVIMIAAGVGIAPFRGFMQARAAEEARGKNWLFFGNQRAQEDFLYQTEWQAWAKDGVLNRYAFAFSRDGKEKVYVQHKIRQHQKELWQWLEEGAYIYICGDAKNMAKEVQNALIQVIQEEGKMTQEEAENHLNELREAKRYQRDVY